MSQLTHFALRLDTDTHRAVGIYAHIMDMSMNEVINRACREYLLAHRDEEFAAALADAQARYAGALEKLKDL